MQIEYLLIKCLFVDHQGREEFDLRGNFPQRHSDFMPSNVAEDHTEQ